MRTKVEAWSLGVRTLCKTAKRYPQSAYVVLGMLLHIEWQYLQRTVPGVGTLMSPIGDSLIEAPLPCNFWRKGGEHRPQRNPSS